MGKYVNTFLEVKRLDSIRFLKIKRIESLGKKLGISQKELVEKILVSSDREFLPVVFKSYTVNDLYYSES